MAKSLWRTDFIDHQPFVGTVMYLLQDVSFEGMNFDVLLEGDRVFVQGFYLERDTVSGELEEQRTRKWLIEESMSQSQMVSTVFALCMASMEHRTREWFTFKERSVYMPHFDVHDLYLVHESVAVRDREAEKE